MTEGGVRGHYHGVSATRRRGWWRAYAIGIADPVSVLVDTKNTEKVSVENLDKLVRKHFPLTPPGIIDHLKLRRPISRKTVAYGHFGRNEPEFSWEKTDKTKALRKVAGL